MKTKHQSNKNIEYTHCSSCGCLPNGRGKRRVWCCRTDIHKLSKEAARIAWNRIHLVDNVETIKSDEERH